MSAVPPNRFGICGGENPGLTMTVIGHHLPKWMLDMQAVYPELKVTGFVDDVRPIRDGSGTKLEVLDALATNKPLVSDPIACEGIDVIDK